MINQTIHKIVKQFSNKHSDGFIKFDLYSKFDKELLASLALNLDLKEEYLQFINCPQCDEEIEIRTRDRIRYIHCFNAGCGSKRELKNNEDLAYKMTIGGIADFLIKVLEIRVNKKNLISGKLIKLGQKEIFNLNFDIFLLKEKLSSQEIVDNCKPSSNKTPSIIIKLTNRSLGINQENISECWFSDLIIYDTRLANFNINDRLFIDAVKGCFSGLRKSMSQKWLDNKCLDWFKEQIQNKAIKRGEKEDFQILAMDLYNVSANKYNEIWKNEATKDLKKPGLVSSHKEI